MNKSSALIKNAMGRKAPSNDEEISGIKIITIIHVGIVAQARSILFCPNGFFKISTTSFLKTAIIESNVATCKTIEIKSESLMPNHRLSRTKWPLDETGKNSVNPCTNPKITR